MAKLVQVEITGRDSTVPVFDNVKKNARALSSDMKGIGRSLAGLTQAAQALGLDGFAMMAAQMETAALSSSKLSKSVAQNKLAFLGLVAGITTASYALSDWALKYVPGSDQYIEKANQEMAKMSDTASEVQIKIIALKDAERAAFIKSNAEIDKQIHELEKLGKAAEEPIFQLQRLKKAMEEARDDKGDERRQALFDQLQAARGIIPLESNFGAGSAGGSGRSYRGGEVVSPELTNELLQIRNHYKQMLAEYEKFSNDKEAIAEFSKEVQIQKEKEIADAAIRYQRKELTAKMNLWSQQIAAAGNLFGSLADLAATSGRKGFKMSQTLRYAEAVMSTAAGIARALADYPWPYSLIPAAAVAAAGAAQIATISSQKPPQAHGGLEYVPEESTFLLSKGERVVQPKQNEKLTEFLDGQDGGGGGAQVINLHLDGERIGRAVLRMTRNGRIQIDPRAIRAT